MTPNRLLVVEDESAIAELISINLRHAGFGVTVVASAEAARAEVDRELPALVVLDWMLPGQSGAALCRQWRAEARTRELPVIMLTARADEGDQIQGLEIGADDYLTKPFNPRELLARIATVLRRVVPDELPGAPSEHEEVYCFGAFEFDLSRRSLTQSGKAIALTSG